MGVTLCNCKDLYLLYSSHWAFSKVDSFLSQAFRIAASYSRFCLLRVLDEQDLDSEWIGIMYARWWNTNSTVTSTQASQAPGQAQRF